MCNGQRNDAFPLVLGIAMTIRSLTSIFSGFSAICIEDWAFPANVEVSENVSNGDIALLKLTYVLMTMFAVDAWNCLELLMN